ncbi:TrmB family transcriptional regulator [Salinigranum marinum]|uniref:TrmB family transcriptional regulator n=1 Tax=Salinigranum marinum TaxID=1515595 RepID=UPI002989B225|nr:TrmB family transcriptional regulator [Salinigranum marinum]
MNTAELRAALEEAGLSQYQAEAYNTLLQLGAASATEIADACAVPTARIYDVLRDLESKGYIETYEQDSLHARARNPDEVLDDLRERATLLTDAAEEIEERWEEPAVDTHKVSIVKRFDTVFDRAAALISEAQNEVQLAVTPSQFEELRPALRRAYDNGAIIKLSLHTDEESRTIPNGASFDGIVTEVRHRTLPTPFVALVDRTDTCFAPHAHSLNQYGVLVNDYTLTYVFHWYFLTCLWEVWDTVYSSRSASLPLDYADIRHCVREIEPLLSDGGRVRVAVEGFDTETGKSISFVGDVTDVQYSGGTSSNGAPALSQLAGQVSLSVISGGRVYRVGGWGAVLEDVEATRITVREVTGVS